MKKRLSLVLLCSLAANAQDAVEKSTAGAGQRVQLLTETIADNLKGPYGMFFDSTDLVVTTETDLIKLKLSKPADNNLVDIEVLGELAGGSALGLIKYGNEHVILACGPGCPISRLYTRAMDGSETTLFETPNALVEVRAYNEQFVVSDITGNKLLLISRDGLVNELVSDKLNGPAGIAIDGDNVWVTNFNNGELLRIDGQGHFEVIATGLGMPVGIQYDGKDFIIADFAGGEPGAGRVLRVGKDGRKRVIAEGAFIGNPSAIALQGSDIFVSDILSGKIVKINTPRLSPLPCKIKPKDKPQSKLSAPCRNRTQELQSISN